jgi:hypothetical protein
MAWERSFEAKVMKVRERELSYQKLTFIIEVQSSDFCICLCYDLCCRLPLVLSGIYYHDQNLAELMLISL